MNVSLMRQNKILVCCNLFHKNSALQSLQISSTFKFSFIFTLPCGQTLITNSMHTFFDFKLSHQCIWIHMILISHYLPVQTHHNDNTPTLSNFFGESKEIQSKLNRFATDFNWLTLDINLFYSTLIIRAKFESRNWKQNWFACNFYTTVCYAK